MSKKSFQEILAYLDKIKDINSLNYTEKVNNLKKLKELFSPSWLYFFFSILFLGLSVYFIVSIFFHNIDIGLRFKIFFIILFLFITFLSYQVGIRMYKLNKRIGKDIKILKTTLSLEIKSEEKRLYKLIDEKKAIFINTIKEEFSSEEISEDLIKILCWYIDNEISQKFLDGPILKKTLFCKLAKDFSLKS